MNPNAQVIAHLEAGGCVLTPGLRQARIVRRLHDRAQIAAGKRVWATALVLPLQTWLHDQWRESGAGRHELPYPLSLAALNWIWRREAAGDITGLVDTATLGARARQSWLNLRAHAGSVDELTRYPLTRDQHAFFDWARGVERVLGAHNACDASDLPRLMVERGAIPPPGVPLLLAGFRRLTPAQAGLCEALRASGWSVSQLLPARASQVTRRHAAPEPDAERRAMLAWIRARLDRAPDGLHALIVPDLESQRGPLERALEATLQPDLELPDSAAIGRVFDLAGGPALSTQPVVEAALDAIGTVAGILDWPRASRVLRSRYLAASQAEGDMRVRLDVAMRRLPGVMTPSSVALEKSSEAVGAVRFATCLRSASAAVAGPERRAASAWAEAFGAGLAAWDWPGGARLSSREFQAARHFREILRELASASSFADDLDAAQAYDELWRLAAMPFQPESGEPAVFVLDEYEDPGIRFDSLWVAGLTAATWPRPVAVDPMLPIEIQRRLGMPRVTADACVQEAREILDAWRAASAELVLSWPCRENDTDVDGTPLVPPDLEALVPPADAPTREDLALSASRLEPLRDADLPPIRGVAPGGARIVELQSQCPFRAFAQLRLRAEPLEEPEAGVDRRERGTALHLALHELWAELGSQQALLALDPAARERRVCAAVDRALAQALPEGSGARSRALEREWQCRAIGRLLALDAARSPFTVVETERSLVGAIGGLDLALRVDRVDRVGDSLVVIDYKSGGVRRSPWRGARMEAPQLPLYAALHPARPAAIAIAELGAARAAYRGVSREEGIIETLTAAAEFELNDERGKGFGWDRIREHWYAWLERLASDFARGRTEVDPKLGAETCRSCHLAALCRVAAAPADLVEEGADAD